MALFRLCYRKSGQVSVAIIQAPSLMHAHMRAALLGVDDGARFATRLRKIEGSRGCAGTSIEENGPDPSPDRRSGRSPNWSRSIRNRSASASISMI
jgi:hypothetical protein